MDNDMLTPAMEASFDRIDALLAQLLNRFQERINSSERKISLDLHDRHLVIVPPQTHSDDEICNGFLPREATSLDCKHVLKSCDLVYGFHVSDGVSVPTANVKKAPLCTAVLAYDELMLQTHIGDEIGDGFKRRREPTSPNCPLLHSEVATHEGSNCTSEFLVSADAFKPSAITEPPLMTLPILESECIKGLVAPLSHSVSIMVGSEALQTLDQEAWKQLGFGVDASGRSPHALHLFAEMSHSCWVCNGGTALLDLDLGYHMGIRDKGGGLEVLQKELHDQGFIKNCLVVIFLDSGSLHNFIALALVIGLSWPIDHTHQFDSMLANDGMVLSHGCSHVHFRVQDYDCVHTVFTLPLGNCILDFDTGYLLGIRDQGGGFEVDNGHTGKEEHFCRVYGQEVESLRALLLSPRAHSKGLGAIAMLVSFPVIGEFYVGYQSNSSETMSIVGAASL